MPEGTQIPTDIPQDQISWNKEAFDQMIESMGIRMIHYRAMPDPRGMASKGDNHDVLGIRDSSDNFIYEEAGTLQVLFVNNNTQVSMESEGVVNFATAYMTLPTTYESSGEAVLVAPWDRFYLKDIETRVINSQFVEASTTGLDRLHYPATCVEFLMDANGVKYCEGKDFQLTQDGDIKWLTQNRPGWNAQIGKGVVYSIRYRYTPFFVVSHLVHEIRVGQVTNEATFDRKVERFPYQCLVVRERVFYDTNRDSNKPISDDRYQAAPPSGGFLGPK